MSIGQRKPVRLVHIENVQSATGNWVQQPKTTYNRWAEVFNPSGFRDYLNGQTQLGESKTFLIRFDFNLLPGAEWRVQYLGKEYTITSIERDNEKKFYWRLRGTAK